MKSFEQKGERLLDSEKESQQTIEIKEEGKNVY